MIGPRWKKVASDLWSNPTRTALVVLSIFIGIFATGLINATRQIVSEELANSYQRTNPADATYNFSSADSFDEDLIAAVEKIDGVVEAEGRRSLSLNVFVGPDTKESIRLTAIDDFDEIDIKKISTVAGAKEPRDKEVLLERSSMKELGLDIGDSVVVERNDGKQRVMEIAGLVHDLSVQPTSMSGNYYGYITPNTAEWLGGATDFTEMLVDIDKSTVNRELLFASVTAEQLKESRGGMPGGGRGGGGGGHPGMGRPRVDLVTTLILQEITSKIEKSDRDVRTPRGPPRDGSEHWATGLIDNLSVMMSALGVMSIVLSGFLVTNTISALLAQQTRQIGIMKAIGARTTQMMMMYMVLVLGFGMLSLLVAIPATLWATDVFVNVVADYFNFDLSQAIFPQDVLRLQIIAGLAIPVVASLIPVFRGTRVTVLEALNDITIETRKSKARKEFIKKVFWWIFLPVRLLFWPIRLILTPIWRLLCYIVVGALKRPLLLAVRNTFRRKVRVSLTLFTLMIGGLIFIGIFSIRTSLINTLNTFIDREFQFDAVVLFDKSYRDYYIIDEAERVPGVALAEPWLDGSVSRIYPDDTESDPISVSGVLYNTELVDPVIIEGRWLLPEDERAIVVTRGVLEDDPDMTVGTEVVLSINEEESTWKVVGVATSIGDSREGYVPYEQYSRAIGEVGKISTTRIKMAPGFDIAPEVFEETLKQHFELQGITVNRVFSIDVLLERVTEQFDFIVMALLAMAILIAVVGGLGLAGTMSLNVIERIREIGVMRAIGASDSMILQIFLGEGIIIGLISWFFGAAFSFPVSKFLSDLMGQMFFRTPLTFDFSFEGMGIWLAFSTGMAILASFLPAWNAARLSIRNALAFE